MRFIGFVGWAIYPISYFLGVLCKLPDSEGGALDGNYCEGAAAAFRNAIYSPGTAVIYAD